LTGHRTGSNIAVETTVVQIQGSTVGDRRHAAYQALLRRVQGMAAAQTSAEFLQLVSQHVRELVPFDAFSIWSHEPTEHMIRQLLFEVDGVSGRAVPRERAPVEFGPIGRVVSTQQPVVLKLHGGPAPPVAVALHAAGFHVMCLVPASTPDVHWGVLGIASREADDYSPDIVALLGQIASRVALAMELLAPVDRVVDDADRIQGPVDRTHLLLRLTNAVTSERHLPDLLKTISALLRETIPHHYASLSLWDDAAQGLRRWAAVQPATVAPIPEGVFLNADEPPWLAFNSGDVIELRKEAFDTPRTEVTGALGVRGVQSGVCLPLKTKRGKYGVLNVGSSQPDAFPVSEIMLLWQIARQLAVAIENALVFDRAERYRLEASADRDRFKLLLDVNNTLVSQLDAHALWLSVFKTVREALDHDYASLITFEAGGRELRLEAATCYDERGVIESHVTLHQLPSDLSFESGAPRVFTGAELDQFDFPGVAAMRSAGLQCLCCVPLLTRRGVIGALNVASRREDAFAPADIDLLRDIAGQVAIAVENTVAFREISDLKNRLAEEKLYLEGEVTSQHDFTEIIGNSPALRGALHQIQTVAPTDATVLLLGETGTGKELLARALHDLSQRRERPFIRLNGAALPTGLIESELFGYERGAFTGAVQTKAGRLELAHRGTLFLDEVGDIPAEVQPKLLRVIQEREFERLGSGHTQRVDVRLVAATNRNLEEMVAGSTFRSDLYYRLSVFPIHVPPLRDRQGDIPALVSHFARKCSRAMGRQITTIPKSTMDALEQWHWPGNIRELQNVIERAVILSTGSSLQVPAAALRTVGTDEPVESSPAETRYRVGERDLILKALSQSRGVIAGPEGAAARLGLKRTTLHSKMRKLGIRRPSF
jgi:formate hydrogenlyase transcriptional activator